ncbi:MAG TPA: ATP-dependent Clp protease proteolytic subunit [Solirubrobacterales bacterium]|jgi:ATP-dependent protease ClpP protease subunit|nr:ATP-dependent Clp protease proteolytic subunit [Solirubrobacterales bacterium]
MDRDRFFTPKEAQEYGLIDRTIEHRDLERPPTGFVSGGG